MFLCAYLDRIPTLSNLIMRGIPITSPCVLCNEPIEPTSPCMFDCSFTKKVWRKILSWCDLNSSLVLTVDEVCVRTFFSSSLDNRILKVLQAFITIWAISKRRNQLVLSTEDKVQVVMYEDIFPFIQICSLLWISNCYEKGFFDWSSWLYYPRNMIV